MRYLHLATAALILVGLAPAQANQPAAKTGANAAAAQGTQPTAGRKVCRTVEPTGSNRIERICLTKADWARVDKAMKNSF